MSDRTAESLSERQRSKNPNTAPQLSNNRRERSIGSDSKIWRVQPRTNNGNHFELFSPLALL
jgi:hypothetical protein